MRLAIIGAGNVARAIGRGGVETGQEVVITSTDPDKARAVAGELGASAAANNAEAVRDAEIVVLAVPYQAIAAVADEIREAVSGKVVIDATNPIKPDYSGLAVTERSGAEELQELLPGASVVKAFNTVLAANQADPQVEGMPVDGFYAGDDDDAKDQVAELLSALGFRTIDVGGLTGARALEHMAFLNITMNASNGWPWQSAWKLVGPTG